MTSNPLRTAVIGSIPIALLLSTSRCAPVPGPAANESATQAQAPSEWVQWANWIERRHAVADSLGHSPTPGSDEWAIALDRRLGITDREGHGPDPGSDEWRRAVEYKLSATQRTAP